MLLSIVIPVYNEEKTIRKIVSRVQDLGLDMELILVDDASKDGSWEVLQELAREYGNVRVFRQSPNQGKGAALRRGFEEVKGDYVIVQDADLEYDPQDINQLLSEIKKHEKTVIYGSRFMGRSKKELYKEGKMQWAHLLGNKFLTLLTNALYGSRLTDMETCYKLIPRQLVQTIKIESNRFNFEPEITAKILKRGYKIVEVPIHYEGRTVHEGKNISWKDGPAALWALIRFRFLD